MTFYDDLDLSLAEARDLIEQGATDRRSAAHTPSIATLNRNGLPSQRVMILRHVDWSKRALRFHTDARSAKIEEVRARGEASVLFYLPDAKVQIRLQGVATTLTQGPLLDTAWDTSTPFARRCYMAEEAPGAHSDFPVSGLPDWVEGKQPTLAEVGPAKANFAVFLFEFNSIEWLYLANSGHRRARWGWADEAQSWQGSWLVP
jgi:pyridoxamine 5'-phosphate oxidase